MSMTSEQMEAKDNAFLEEARDKLMLTDKQFYNASIIGLCTLESAYHKDVESYNDSMDVRRNYRDRLNYIEKYGFAYMNRKTLTDLKKYISNRKCLEVCAGTGYLSMLLTCRGISITATDNGIFEDTRMPSWSRHHYFKMERVDAVKAIDNHPEAEVVIMSWPDYQSRIAHDVLQRCIELGKELIYIGEWRSGCTADDSFFDLIVEQCDCSLISDNYESFAGIYDTIFAIAKKK